MIVLPFFVWLASQGDSEMKILNIGSLNIDYVYDVEHFVRRGETIPSANRSVFAGGKGLNQSIALARAGATVLHAGLIGQEGAHLCDLLSESGADVSLVRVLPNCPTGHAIIQRDSDGDNCIVLYGGANAKVDEAFIDAALDSCEEGDWVLLQNEAGALGYAIKEAVHRGLKVILNPSPVNECLMECPLDLVDCFVLNEGEASLLSGSNKCGADILVDMHEKYPTAQVVLTLGERGSIAVCQDGEVFSQEACRVDVVDTTAAGDTFTGYLLASLSDGSGMADALEVASAASAIAVTRPGASPSIPCLGEVLDSLETKKGRD